MSLKEKLQKEISDTFEDGTVVRFVWTPAASVAEIERVGVSYTFVTIFIAGGWWLSGSRNSFGREKMTTSQFLDILRSSEVSNIEVPKVWGFCPKFILVPINFLGTLGMEL